MLSSWLSSTISILVTLLTPFYNDDPSGLFQLAFA